MDTSIPSSPYAEVQNGGLRCLLCPHRCALSEGQWGICRIRKNENGRIVLPFYGVLSAVAVDPIEKKPLYHFHPGSSIFSIGFYGCNFRCPFCQNYRISQVTDSSSPRTPPKAVADEALRSGSFAVAYTYSEPLVHLEYLLDTATECRKRGLKNVLVSNGYLNPQPADEILSWMDAANIDLKGWKEDFYRREIKGSLEPVREFIRLASRKVHLEVTTLVIPGKNDDPDEIEQAAQFLSSLKPDIPYHLSCYFPRYKYSIRPTTEGDLRPLIQRARKHLRFVYAGNTGGGNTTYCPSCGQEVIRRQGYRVNVVGGRGGKCSRCGESIYVE